MELIIEPLTKENLDNRINDLIILEHNWTELGETAWNQDNFLMELPGKWKLSVLAIIEGKIVGYAIASLDENIAKLNKIIVDNSYRNQGIASKLWEFVLAKCREIGVYRLEFKALKENIPALEFYKKKNCVFYGQSLGSDNRLRYNIKYVFKTSRIKHSLPTINEDDAAAVYNCVKGNNIATKNIVNEFINEFKNFIEKDFGFAVNSGTSALHIALRALDIKEKDEVIIPSYVCSSVLNAVNYCRATPIIADINDNDFNISFDSVRRKITENTRAIIIPHMFGKPVFNIEGFTKLNIPIIEDCALSVGAVHNGKKVGSFGDIAVFSFYATKVMTTGHGGMILTDSEDLNEKINDLLKYDNREKFGESYNYSMSDINASLGLMQLKKLNDFIKRRIGIAEIYGNLLKNSKDIKLPENDGENIFFRYIIRSNNSKFFIQNLLNRGVDVSKPVFKPIHKYLNLSDLDFPNTVQAYEEAVSIPIYPSLSDEEVYDIASMILNMEDESREER